MTPTAMILTPSAAPVTTIAPSPLPAAVTGFGALLAAAILPPAAPGALPTDGTTQPSETAAAPPATAPGAPAMPVMAVPPATAATVPPPSAGPELPPAGPELPPAASELPPAVTGARAAVILPPAASPQRGTGRSTDSVAAPLDAASDDARDEPVVPPPAAVPAIDAMPVTPATLPSIVTQAPTPIPEAIAADTGQGAAAPAAPPTPRGAPASPPDRPTLASLPAVSAPVSLVTSPAAVAAPSPTATVAGPPDVAAPVPASPLPAPPPPTADPAPVAAPAATVPAPRPSGPARALAPPPAPPVATRPRAAPALADTAAPDTPIATPITAPIADFAAPRAPQRIVTVPEPPAPLPEARVPAATEIAVTSQRLGAVQIGIEGAVDDLRVSLGLSPAAAAIVASDAPRLLADLAATGVRVQALDVSGGGLSGSASQQQAPHTPFQPPSAGRAVPDPAFAVPATPSRGPRASDRYA